MSTRSLVFSLLSLSERQTVLRGFGCSATSLPWKEPFRDFVPLKQHDELLESVRHRGFTDMGTGFLKIGHVVPFQAERHKVHTVRRTVSMARITQTGSFQRSLVAEDPKLRRNVWRAVRQWTGLISV